MKTCVLVLCVFAGCGFAQQVGKQTAPDSFLSVWKSRGNWNGRLWRALSSAEEKDVYLFGYLDAVNRVSIGLSQGSYDRYMQLRNRFGIENLTIDEVRSSLDRFYATQENGPISISDAIWVIHQRAAGEDEASIEKRIAGLRASASKDAESSH